MMRTLKECCLVEIVTHLEYYSLQELCLLPGSIRQDLLIHLPVADLYGFERTSVSEGVNMEAVWYAKCQLDVNIRPDMNVEVKRPARCVEHVTRRKWAPGPMARILLEDHHKRSWQDYYLDSIHGHLFGAWSAIIQGELVQSLFYAPLNYRYALYLVHYGKEDTDLVCCCSFKRIEFLYQGFYNPPRYQKYKPGEIYREELTKLFLQFSKAGPRRLEVPMILGMHGKWFVGPNQTQGLSNLHVLVYEVDMQCRLTKEEDFDFAKHFEIISSIQGTKPVLHTLKLLDSNASPDDERHTPWRRRKEKIEPAILTKAASTTAYQNLQCICIGGSVIKPYVEHLLPLINNQPNLHSLEIVFGTWKERFTLPPQALQSLLTFVKRPHFKLLGLGGVKLPATFFCETIQEFLLTSAQQKVTLYISESEVASTDVARITNVPVKEVCPGSTLPFIPKSLSIKYLANNCPTLGSKYILPIVKSTALYLQVLDVSDCGFADPQEMLSTLAYHPDLTVDILDISSNILPQTEACCKVLEDLLQNLSSLQEFHANHCGLGNPSLLASFVRTLTANSSRTEVRVLGLAQNGFFKCSKGALLSLFSSICHLPHLSNLGLSYNQLLPEHAELFHEAWKESCRTKLSSIGWRLAPPPTVVQTWPPVEEPLEKQKCRAILSDTCWNLLL